MPDLSSLTTLSPYHLLTWGTLLGSSVFQSFIGGITSYRALPRAQFASLQAALTPVYFTLQTGLSLALVLTYPGDRLRGIASGLGGFMAETDRSGILGPMLVMFVTSAANLVALGPATTRVMKERKHQETRDGKKYSDAGPQSSEMQRLNTSFGRLHSASALINMAGLLATMWYGVTLADRLSLRV